jgi:hypothetical protein
MKEELFKILDDWATEVIADIRQVLIDKDINATGKLSKSLRPDIRENELIIWAVEHAIWTDRGRAPTVNDGPGDLLPAIIEWMKAKKVVGNPYQITKSIHMYGTRAFRKGINREVFDNATFWQPRIEKLKISMQKYYISKINNITSELWR